MTFWTPANTKHPGGGALKYVQATISNSVLTLADISGITAAHLDNATTVFITVRSNSFNFTWDGTAPTTTTGHAVSTTITLYGRTQISKLKLICNGSSDAVIDITLEK